MDDQGPAATSNEEFPERLSLEERLRQWPWFRIPLWLSVSSGVAWIALNTVAAVPPPHLTPPSLLESPLASSHPDKASGGEPVGPCVEGAARESATEPFGLEPEPELARVD